MEIGEDVVRLQVTFPLQPDPDLFFEFWTGIGERFKFGNHVEGLVEGEVSDQRGSRVRVSIGAERRVPIDRLEVRNRPVLDATPA